jgi:hypothetical protein
VHIVMRLTLPDRVSATMLEISCFVTGDRFYKCSTTTSWAHLNLTTGCGRARHAIGCASRGSSDAHAPFQTPLPIPYRSHGFLATYFVDLERLRSAMGGLAQCINHHHAKPMLVCEVEGAPGDFSNVLFSSEAAGCALLGRGARERHAVQVRDYRHHADGRHPDAR